MAVNVGPFLALTDDWDVPCPEVFDQLAVFLFGVVELLELVALPVRGDVESGDVLLAANQESTTDEALVVLAIDRGSTEEVLARSLETSEETANQVVSHEGELKLVIIFVVNKPERVLFGLVVLPEPGHGDRTGIIVGVLALPLVKDQSGLAKGLKRVLGLGLGLHIRLVLILSSRLGSLLLRLLLLLGRGVFDGLVDEGSFGDSFLPVTLVNNGVEPTGNSDEVRAELLVKDSGESATDDTGSEDISKGDTLTDEVSVGSEVSLQDFKSSAAGSGVVLYSLLVVGHSANEREVPATKASEEVGVGEGHPAKDGRIVLLGGAQEGGLLVLGGDYIESAIEHVSFVLHLNGNQKDEAKRQSQIRVGSYQHKRELR